MLKTGLCSITFRTLSAEQVIDLAVKAGLNGIEWGGDVHVPPGDTARAEEVAAKTRQAGLEVSSYGSYYRVGEKNKNQDSFEDILQTAAALNAPSIRVWAGNRGSNEADDAHWNKVVDDARRIASIAERQRIFVNFEYHGGTLTDTKESAYRLMDKIEHRNAGLYWQPAVGATVEERIDSIHKIQKWLTHVHVFQWKGTDRLELSEGKQEWMNYLEVLEVTSDDRYLMLEFVKNDDPEQFFRDAQTLRDLLKRQLSKS